MSWQTYENKYKSRKAHKLYEIDWIFYMQSKKAAPNVLETNNKHVQNYFGEKREKEYSVHMIIHPLESQHTITKNY